MSMAWAEDTHKRIDLHMPHSKGSRQHVDILPFGSVRQQIKRTEHLKETENGLDPRRLVSYVYLVYIIRTAPWTILGSECVSRLLVKLAHEKVNQKLCTNHFSDAHC